MKSEQLGNQRLGYYEYNALLPDAILNVIQQAIREVTEEAKGQQRDLECAPWWQGLPVWRIKDEKDGRSNEVVISSIKTAEGKILSFRADAWIDTCLENGNVQDRTFASPNSVVATSIDHSVETLEQLSEDERKSLFVQTIKTTFTKADKLVPTERHQVRK